MVYNLAPIVMEILAEIVMESGNMAYKSSQAFPLLKIYILDLNCSKKRTSFS